MVRELLDSRERDYKHNFFRYFLSQFFAPFAKVLVFFCLNSEEESGGRPPVSVPVAPVNFCVDRTIIVSQSVDPDKITPFRE